MEMEYVRKEMDIRALESNNSDANTPIINSKNITLLTQLLSSSAPEKKIFLLKGGPLIGKSTIIKQSITHFKSNHYKGSGVTSLTPLYLSLATSDQNIQTKLNSFFPKNPDANKRFLLILDDFEAKADLRIAYKMGLLAKKGVEKVIIVCRHAFLEFEGAWGTYKSYLAFEEFGGRKAFMEVKLEEYCQFEMLRLVEKHCNYQPSDSTWSLENYLWYIQNLPGLELICKNIFLLNTFLKGVNTIIKNPLPPNSEKKPSKEELVKVYRHLLNEWFNYHVKRSIDSGLTKDWDEAYNDCWEYAETLAKTLYEDGSELTCINTEGRWKSFFISESLRMVHARDACPLLWKDNAEVIFLTPFLQGYLHACNQNLNKSRSKPLFTSEVKLVKKFTLEELKNDPLNLGILVENTDRIAFEAGEARRNSIRLRFLKALVNASKKEPECAIGSINAMTIMNTAGILFSGWKLNGVKLSAFDDRSDKRVGARLVGGYFDKTDFSSTPEGPPTDLRFVDFSNSWLRGANLSHALLTGVITQELSILYHGGSYSNSTVCFFDDYFIFLNAKETHLVEVYSTSQLSPLLTHTIESKNKDDIYLSKIAGIERNSHFLYIVNVEKIDVINLKERKLVRQVNLPEKMLVNKIEKLIVSGDLILVCFGIQTNRARETLRPWIDQIWSTTKNKILWGKIPLPVKGVVRFVEGPEPIFISFEHKISSIWVIRNQIFKKVKFDYDIPNILFIDDNFKNFISISADGENHSVRSFSQKSHHQQLIIDRSESFSLSKDGRFFVQGFNNSKMIVWDVHTQKRVSEIFGHNSHIHGVFLSRNGEFILSTSCDDTIRKWRLVGNIKTSKPSPFRDIHHDCISHIEISENNSIIATGTRNGVINVWKPLSGKNLFSITQSDELTALSVSYDGSKVASGSRNGVVRVWHLADKKLKQICKLSPKDFGVLETSTSCVCELDFGNQNNANVIAIAMSISSKMQQGDRTYYRIQEKLSKFIISNRKIIELKEEQGYSRVDIPPFKICGLRFGDKITYGKWQNYEHVSLVGGSMPGFAYKPSENYLSIFRIPYENIQNLKPYTQEYKWANQGQSLIHHESEKWVHDSVYISKSSYRLASGFKNKVIFWNTQTGNPTRVITGDFGYVRSTFTSFHEGNFGACTDDSVREWVWDPGDDAGKYKEYRINFPDGVSKISAFCNEEKKYLVTGMYKGQVLLWEKNKRINNSWRLKWASEKNAFLHLDSCDVRGATLDSQLYTLFNSKGGITDDEFINKKSTTNSHSNAELSFSGETETSEFIPQTSYQLILESVPTPTVQDEQKPKHHKTVNHNNYIEEKISFEDDSTDIEATEKMEKESDDFSVNYSAKSDKKTICPTCLIL